MSSNELAIGGVLTCLMKQFGVNVSILAEKINIPRSTINRIALGQTPDPRASTVQAIADYFNVSTDQLMGKQPLFDTSNGQILPGNFSSIPIIPLDQAHHWQIHLKTADYHTHHGWLAIDPSGKQGKFAVILRGESMTPRFEEKTLLIVDPAATPKNRNFVLAYITKTRETLFRQLLIDGSYQYLKPINSIFPTVPIDSKDRIIGTIVQTREYL